MVKCPGQDQRYWKPEDIFNVRYPHCGDEIEFWKDEPYRNCPECHKMVRNPRLDAGCAKEGKSVCAESDRSGWRREERDCWYQG